MYMFACPNGKKVGFTFLALSDIVLNFSRRVSYGTGWWLVIDTRVPFSPYHFVFKSPHKSGLLVMK